jgi:hypothetical protein
MTDITDDVIDALEAALEWIDAVPENTELPAMPGFDRDKVNELIASAKRQRERQAVAVPDGWKLVPIEPTEAMLDDGQESLARVIDPTFEDVLSAYKAMLSAAPDCPQPIVEELTK